MLVIENVDVVRAVVAANGNMRLAAERLTRASGERTYTEADIIDIVTGDKSIAGQLTQRFNALLQIKTFDLLMQAQIALLGVMGDMDANKLGATYGVLLGAYSQLTKQDDTVSRNDIIGIIESVAHDKGLPPAAAREAVMAAERYLRGNVS